MLGECRQLSEKECKKKSMTERVARTIAKCRSECILAVQTNIWENKIVWDFEL